jgi:hypothetical protein
VSRDAGAGRAYLQILDAVILQRAGHPRVLEERDAVLQPRAPQACHKNDRCAATGFWGPAPFVRKTALLRAVGALRWRCAECAPR